VAERERQRSHWKAKLDQLVTLAAGRD